MLISYVTSACIYSTSSRADRPPFRPWKMYPLGILFGLGFDTSSEIALLGISSIQAAKGMSIWLILIFPILFTAGMCLIDTLDGALMLTLYIMPASYLTGSDTPAGQGTTTASSGRSKDPIAFLYYSIILTSITVAVAIVIGVIQLLTMILAAAQPKGKFWDGVQVAGDHYEVIGGGICASFVILGIVSVLVYKPWRRWVDQLRSVRWQGERVVDEEVGTADAGPHQDVGRDLTEPANVR